jgi:hypothetical protein
MAPGYCRCSWQQWCFDNNKDCNACWQAWDDGPAWAERISPKQDSIEVEKLNQLEAELILSEAARDAEAAAAAFAAEKRAEKRAAKKANKLFEAVRAAKRAEKKKAEKKAAKKSKAAKKANKKSKADKKANKKSKAERAECIDFDEALFG